MDEQQREPGRRRRPPTRPIEPTLPLDMPRADRPDVSAAGPRRAKRAPVEPEDDLFGPGDPAADAVPPCTASPSLPTDPPLPEPEPNTGHPGTADATPSPSPNHDAAGVLAPDAVLLQRVDPRSFRPNERADAWLYWLTDRGQAEAALSHGLPIEPDAAVVLADRPSVLPRLAALAEDPEFSPHAIAVLRLRRVAVAPFLRPGPEPASYVLSGEAGLPA